MYAVPFFNAESLTTDVMSNEQANSIEQAVWPWRDPLAKDKAGPAARRWRAVIQAGVVAGVASLFLFYGRHYGFSLFLYVLSAIILLSGLFVPSVFNLFEQFGRRLGIWVSTGITWLLLVPFFYLCVLPGRLILILLGKDPMCRCWERGRQSYWVDRKPAPPQFYTRQY